MSDPATLEALMQSVEGFDDNQIWHVTVAFVGLCGSRAHEVGRLPVEQLCWDFMRRMHVLTGTPALVKEH